VDARRLREHLQHLLRSAESGMEHALRGESIRIDTDLGIHPAEDADPQRQWGARSDPPARLHIEVRLERRLHVLLDLR